MQCYFRVSTGIRANYMRPRGKKRALSQLISASEFLNRIVLANAINAFPNFYKFTRQKSLTCVLFTFYFLNVSQESGFFKTSDSTRAVCTAGSFCPGDGTAAPCAATCPGGEYISGSCPAGLAISGLGCAKCEPGTFRAGEVTGSGGAPCPGDGCVNGVNLGATRCTGICSAGFYCPLGSVEQLPCSDADEHQAEEGQGSCDDVPVGSYKTANNDIDPCNAGYRCPGDGFRYSCNEDNRYQDEVGQENCKAVDPKWFKNLDAVPKNSGILSCERGKKCTGDGNQIACSSADEYQDLQGQAACKKVPQGFYKNLAAKPSNSNIVVCEAGFRCPGNGLRYPCAGSDEIQPQESQAVCGVVPAGWYKVNDYVLSLPCEPGYRCVVRTFILPSNHTMHR